MYGGRSGTELRPISTRATLVHDPAIPVMAAGNQICRAWGCDWLIHIYDDVLTEILTIGRPISVLSPDCDTPEYSTLNLDWLPDKSSY